MITVYRFQFNHVHYPLHIGGWRAGGGGVGDRDRGWGGVGTWIGVDGRGREIKRVGGSKGEGNWWGKEKIVTFHAILHYEKHNQYV